MSWYVVHCLDHCKTIQPRGVWYHRNPVACKGVTVDIVVPGEALIQIKTLADLLTDTQYMVLTDLLLDTLSCLASLCYRESVTTTTRQRARIVVDQIESFETIHIVLTAHVKQFEQSG